MKKLKWFPRAASHYQEHMMKIVQQIKVATYAALLCALMCLSIPVSYASDIEIYKIPEDAVGNTTLMFMLDLSGSMGTGSINVDYGTGNCTVATDTTSATYSRYYCSVASNTTNSKVKDADTGCEKQTNGSYRCYDRVTRLKDGLRDILQGTTTVPRVSDKIVIGMSTFAGDNGYIRVPARPLSEVVRSYQVAETYIEQEEYQEQVVSGYTTQSYNYNQPRWARYTNTESESYRCGFLNLFTCYRDVNITYYQTCNWNSTSQACSWSGATTSIPTGFNASLANYACSSGNNNNCKVFYEVKQGTQQIPVYETVTKTRPVERTRYVTKNVTQRDLLLETINDLKANGGTPTPYAYSEVAAYLMGQPTSNSGYSGFNLSTPDAKNAAGTSYKAPSSITDQMTNADKRECSGQGIYFLTDGQPEPGGTATGWDGKSGTAYNLMNATLGSKANQFDCSVSPLGNRSSYASNINGWACIGKYTQALLDPAKNPVNLKIKTAVVGFGSSFGGGTTTNDVEDAKSWGTIGEGGWKAGSKPKDVSDSINKFVGELNKDIPTMSTGSSTIPTDALNPAAVQPFSYFPQFEPKVNPVDTQQIWFGNVKKYYVLNNGVYASQTASDSSVVVKKSKLQDLADIWAKSGVTYAENAPIFKKGGALSQLPLGTSSAANGEINTARNLLTDYSYDGSKPADQRKGRDLGLIRIKYTYTTDEKTKTDTTYTKALMALLGYSIAEDVNTENLNLSNQPVTIRQMGSILHSNPILLTQEGKASATRDSSGKVVVGTTNREDYALFGTTQGIVQVVNADTGIEKFAFVPKEIIERQSETFKANGGNLAAGKEALYYGMDGEWTAHTIYVTKSDGTLTVKGIARNVVDSDEKENLSGKQWVYGGMRMGGRSYYALDLTDINNPKVKFHIDPTTSKVYTPSNPSGTTFTALANMAQSWSKPTLGYINWKGKRKLVMFVGGGYDAGGDTGDGQYANGLRTGYAGYENYNYQQTNKKGAGVYMFDADNGDLLWNAGSSTNSDLKYSVASPIRAIDRNNDGIIDHLYFGDLAGQAFRVDFKNDGSKTAFTAQATRILNLHQDDGTSPRFYTLPTFTAHSSAGKTEGGNIVIATFVSGNKSSPLLATSDSPATTGKKDPSGLQYDGAYALYDYDAYPSTAEGRYPTTAIAARTLAGVSETTPNLAKLKYINGATTGAAITKTGGWGGWYYQFNKKFNGANAAASIIKSLTNPLALQGSLYVTQFDASDNGTTSSCGAGVKGNSFTERLCLPTGVCTENAKYKYNLGSGIVTINVGGGSNGNLYERSLVVPDPNDACVGDSCTTCVGEDCDGEFINTGGNYKFIPHRWYEKYAQSATP